MTYGCEMLKYHLMYLKVISIPVTTTWPKSWADNTQSRIFE